VPVLTAGQTTGGLPFYTMPYIDGASLRARLDVGPLPFAEAVGVLRDVVRPGDCILVKASRAVGLEAVAEAVAAVGAEVAR
jgi:hypothetical protein